ncbi:MAG: hypothetical protein ACLSUK_17430 [Hungatella sp.]|jgi:hypothetical protein|uniref:Uncharacterized protein n=1 Tax=Hungatella hathewayi TaxID=154046 RepID=A0A374P6A9_9FIRM|nr:MULTISPECIES: hypothetical protein [Hungatella]MBC5702494.1 hypothetical protein [Hungatella sp. L36]MBS5242102.1 hypothetical protein [Hungatella hathewayi]MDU0927051.1 hypothetical protein [Hungatella hathewayi]RGJ01951.1 hypothetical protein DXD79_17295 [Hungatella hathewayi]RGK95613.1 hypothetical protein DXC88_14555 [Hungatella hathewayi]
MMDNGNELMYNGICMVRNDRKLLFVLEASPCRESKKHISDSRIYINFTAGRVWRRRNTYYSAGGRTFLVSRMKEENYEDNISVDGFPEPALS